MLSDTYTNIHMFEGMLGNDIRFTFQILTNASQTHVRMVVHVKMNFNLICTHVLVLVVILMSIVTVVSHVELCYVMHEE